MLTSAEHTVNKAKKPLALKKQKA